jgi:hypothetical protein
MPFTFQVAIFMAVIAPVSQMTEVARHVLADGVFSGRRARPACTMVPMLPMKHAGILAHSADGAALCFLEMVREAARHLGAHQHPEITLSILPMGRTLAAWEAMDLASIDAHLRRSAQRLADAGCDFFVCPDNTAHIALDAAQEPYPSPASTSPTSSRPAPWPMAAAESPCWARGGPWRGRPIRQRSGAPGSR